MTRNTNIEKEHNPPPKHTKPKGSVNLGRMTFIDEIIRREESQASLRFQAIPGKIYTPIPQAIDSPSTAQVEIQSQVGGSEQSFQDTISLHSNHVRERKSCD